MKREYRRAHLPTSILLALVLAAGCASTAGAPVTAGMVPAEPPAARPTGALRAGVALMPLQGGRAGSTFLSSRMSAVDFEAALRTSLRDAGYLSASPDARFTLEAVIEETRVVDENPSFVVLDRNQTATSTIHYLLTDTRSSATVLDTRIEVPYVAPQKSAFTTKRRNEIAHEGSARESIETLLDQLAALRLPADGAE